MKTLKKITALFLVMMLMLGTASFSGISAFALNEDEIEIDYIIYQPCGHGVQVYEYVDGLAGTVEIPSQIDYYGVTKDVIRIGGLAFYNCNTIREVIIPETVIEIGGSAFLCCENLETVHFYNPDIVINSGVFSGDDNLKNAYIHGTQEQVEKAKSLLNETYDDQLLDALKVFDSITLDKSELTLNYKDTATINATANGKVVWESSNPDIVSVDENGNVKALKKGTATITATVEGTDNSASCNVTVKYSPVQWIVIIVLFGWIWYIKF